MAILKTAGNKIVMPNRNLGNALKFDGVNHYVSVPNNAVIGEIDMQGFYTWSFWINCTSLTPTAAFLVSIEIVGGGSQIFNMFIQGSAVFFQIFNGVTSKRLAYSVAVPNLKNRLNHVVFVMNQYDGTNHKCYVNGVEGTKSVSSNQFTSSDGLTTTTKPMIIGAGITSGVVATTKFPGYMADHSFWKRALSASEVLALYKSRGKIEAVLTSNLIYHFTFDNKNGLTDTDIVSSYVGTLNGYTNAETASSGQPQSGNTAWCDSYSLAPITV